MVKRSHIAGRSREVEAEEHPAQPVFGHAALGGEMVAMDDQGPQLAHVGWGDPNFRQQVGGQQVSQDQGVTFVMFDFGAGNQTDWLGMGHDAPATKLKSGHWDYRNSLSSPVWFPRQRCRGSSGLWIL